jgi:hypothetical protein
MVSIDHTYDEKIHTEYQIKRLHSVVQKMRKEMKAKMWNRVNVFLDTAFATHDIRCMLSKCLNNSNVMLTDFANDTKSMESLDVYARDNYFEWEEFAPNSNLNLNVSNSQKLIKKGRIVVQIDNIHES